MATKLEEGLTYYPAAAMYGAQHGDHEYKLLFD